MKASTSYQIGYKEGFQYASRSDEERKQKSEELKEKISKNGIPKNDSIDDEEAYIQGFKDGYQAANI